MRGMMRMMMGMRTVITSSPKEVGKRIRSKEFSKHFLGILEHEAKSKVKVVFERMSNSSRLMSVTVMTVASMRLIRCAASQTILSILVIDFAFAFC
jgi:hypothetical protein